MRTHLGAAVRAGSLEHQAVLERHVGDGGRQHEGGGQQQAPPAPQTSERSVRLLPSGCKGLELLEQLLAVAGAVVLDNLLRVYAVDDLHGLLEL